MSNREIEIWTELINAMHQFMIILFQSHSKFRNADLSKGHDFLPYADRSEMSEEEL